MSNKKLGQIGEDIAVEYLKKKGYKIIERNYKKAWGEIDVVAKKEGKIIFFEVKTLNGRSANIFPESNITQEKIRRLKKTVETYIHERKITRDYQLDAIGIILLNNNKCKLRHTKNIFLGGWN